MTTGASATESLSDATRLAIERTRLAFERTMMAWVRTSASMITFGFTIYKFFQLDRGREAAPVDRLIGAREFALMLIVVGLATLALAALQHGRSLRALRAHYLGVPIASSQAGILALFMSLVGALALLAVLFRQ